MIKKDKDKREKSGKVSRWVSAKSRKKGGIRSNFCTKKS